MMDESGITPPRLRTRVASAIDPELRSAQGVSTFNTIVLWAILASITTGILATEATVVEAAPILFAVLEGLFFVFFLGEYLVRAWCAPDNPTSTGRLNFLLRPTMLLDAALLIGIALSFLGTTGFLFRLLRLFRVLRIAKLGRYSRAWSVLSTAIHDRKGELFITMGISGMIILVSSALLYLVEGGGQPEAFGSVPRAMWWSIITLTTVGYGDTVPITGLGRCLGAVVALAGIGTIAMPAGILAGAISSALDKHPNSAPPTNGAPDADVPTI